MKYVVYYFYGGGGAIQRRYPEYPDSLTGPSLIAMMKQDLGSLRRYVDHEPHADYHDAMLAANMVGADEEDIRDWLQYNHIPELQKRRADELARKQAGILPANAAPMGAPGTMTVDQHGRRGRVPELELEVFRSKPIDPDAAWKAVEDACKGGGGNIVKR